MQDLVPTSRAAGPSRDLARLCLSPNYSLEQALAAQPKTSTVSLTLKEYEAKLLPTNRLEPRHDGAESRKVREAFAPIGAKMRPDMGPQQAEYWSSAIALALSDLPSWIAVAALDEAVHIPFEFPSEMEAKVREIAERKLAEHQLAVRRLRHLLDELNRPLDQRPKQIEAPAEPEEPYTLDEVRTLLASPYTQAVVRVGIKRGWIRQEDLDIVNAEIVERERSCRDREGENSTAS